MLGMSRIPGSEKKDSNSSSHGKIVVDPVRICI